MCFETVSAVITMHYLYDLNKEENRLFLISWKSVAFKYSWLGYYLKIIESIVS